MEKCSLNPNEHRSLCCGLGRRESNSPQLGVGWAGHRRVQDSDKVYLGLNQHPYTSQSPPCPHSHPLTATISPSTFSARSAPTASTSTRAAAPAAMAPAWPRSHAPSAAPQPPGCSRAPAAAAPSPSTPNPHCTLGTEPFSSGSLQHEAGTPHACTPGELQLKYLREGHGDVGSRTFGGRRWGCPTPPATVVDTSCGFQLTLLFSGPFWGSHHPKHESPAQTPQGTGGSSALWCAWGPTKEVLSPVVGMGSHTQWSFQLRGVDKVPQRRFSAPQWGWGPTPNRVFSPVV